MKKTNNNATENKALENVTKNTTKYRVDETTKKFIINIQTQEEKTISTIRENVETDFFKIVFLQGNNHLADLVDINSGYVFCNVYLPLRIQFTKSKADKYKAELSKNTKFYTHLYHGKDFVSANCETEKEFYSLLKFVEKSILATNKAQATKKAETEKATVKKVESKQKATKKTTVKKATKKVQAKAQ